MGRTRMNPRRRGERNRGVPPPPPLEEDAVTRWKVWDVSLGKYTFSKADDSKEVNVDQEEGDSIEKQEVDDSIVSDPITTRVEERVFTTTSSGQIFCDNEAVCSRGDDADELKSEYGGFPIPVIFEQPTIGSDIIKE